MGEREVLTPEESERAGELIGMLLPQFVMCARLISDEDAELLERGMEAVKQAFDKDEAMMIVHMAAGNRNPLHDPERNRQKRNVPLVEAILAFRKQVQANIEAEQEDQAAEQSREAWRQQFGLR